MLTPGSANRTIVSFLSDWDLEATGDDIPVKPLHHRTGAAAFTFRATDLLVPRPAPRLYRHDLESFFYILIWAALHYDFKHKTRTSRVHSVVRKWTSSDMELAQTRKICLVLSNVYGIDEIIAHISPQCQALLVPWIQVIWDLFDEGNADCRTYRKMSHTGNAAVWDNKTFGGWITFEKFMEAIGRTPRLEDSAPAC
ncbi:hypothetical protein DXG03_005549 [Asterophora parasitica]|uniref:Fungal-type protein kinase domain-containing protein n=1 Tax=Asterophora parasitica TaxID=117018 RepID=A0A9P7G1U5_9AGAR|nr:hypothetical protein DXG03_005549 [Asterophora parasitica]